MSQPPPATDTNQPGATAWSAEQLARLAYEWRHLRRAFAYHPTVDVIPLSGDPPTEYQVNYRVTTLAIDQAGQLAYVTSCPTHVWLPPLFPHNAPVVRPMTTAFHPNVAMEWVHLHPAWRPDATLVDVVSQVGTLLAFQTYDPAAVANPVAMSWVFANPHLLPTDASATFSPDADGGPAERVARFGPETLRALREKLESAAERLVLADTPPGEVELGQVTREAESALPLFLDDDIPAHLRASAVELSEFAESLKGSEPVWSQVGRHLGISKELAAAGGELAKAEEMLRRVLLVEAARPAGALEGGAGSHDEPSGKSTSAPHRGPTSTALQTVAALRRAVQEADQAVTAFRERLGWLATIPRVGPPNAAGSLFSRRLERELVRLSEASEPARASGSSLASLEPVLHLARREFAAAERVAAWAEHRELLRRGQELVDRLNATGPVNLQAYHTQTASGRAGPFEFEQRVDPADGGPPVAVWNLRAGLVRVVDAAQETVIGRGDRRVELPRPAGPLSVVVGEHTEELRSQLESLLERAGDALARLRPPEEEAPPPGTPSTWAARLAAELDGIEAQTRVEEDHRRATEHWKLILADLAAVGRFKHRLATYHLLGRLVDFVPRARVERERLLSVMARADALLADIGARSSRDMNTDRLIIPLQYAADYAAHMAERESAQQRVQQIQIAMEGATERLKLRLAKPRLFGSADLPHLRVLSALPAHYADQQPLVTDEALRPLVRRLEELLGTSLPAPPAGAGVDDSGVAPQPPRDHGD